MQSSRPGPSLHPPCRSSAVRPSVASRVPVDTPEGTPARRRGVVERLNDRQGRPGQHLNAVTSVTVTPLFPPSSYEHGAAQW
jgi:hypothetical protein